MQITVLKKKFLLVGFETLIDFNKDFSEEMMWIQSELKRSIERIGNKPKPFQLVGFWQPWQAYSEKINPENVSKAKYFFGVEVLNLEDVPSDFVVKVIQESEYASCQEEERGTAPKEEMCTIFGYELNQEVAGDFEIFSDFEHLGPNDLCEVLVPIKLRK